MGSLDKDVTSKENIKPKREISPEHREKMRANMAKAREVYRNKKALSICNTNPTSDVIDTNDIDVLTSNSIDIKDNGVIDKNGSLNILQEYKKFQDKALPKINSLTLKSLKILENQLNNVKDGDIKSIGQLFSILFDRAKESSQERNSGITSKTYVFNISPK